MCTVHSVYVNIVSVVYVCIAFLRACACLLVCACLTVHVHNVTVCANVCAFVCELSIVCLCVLY